MENFIDKMGDNRFFLWLGITVSAGTLMAVMLLARWLWDRFALAHPSAADKEEASILAALREAEKEKMPR
jgi:hypothetical protein